MTSPIKQQHISALQMWPKSCRILLVLSFVAVESLHSTHDVVMFPCLLREEFSLLNAAFQIIRGGVIPSDIATVQTGDEGKCYMSLLASWGLVADVDIESEKFRKIGETRFVLGECVCVCGYGLIPRPLPAFHCCTLKEWESLVCDIMYTL